MLGYFSFGYVAWIFFSWFFLYMAQVRGFDLKASAQYAMLPFLSMTACCLAGGALSDRLTGKYGLRVGRCGLASIALILTAIFLVLGSQVHSPQLAGVILAGGAGALLPLAEFLLVSLRRYCRPQLRSVFEHGEYGRADRGAVTASLTPWIAQRYGWTTSFSVSAGLAIIGAVCWMTVHPEHPLDETIESA